MRRRARATVRSLLFAILCAAPTSARALETVLVTSTADAGPGSLREALSHGSRIVRLAPGVGGEIVLTRDLVVRGSSIVLDGSAATPDGVLTLRGHGIRLRGGQGARDVTIRNVRIRDAADDGIQVAGGATGIRIENVSISGALDGNLDITQAETRDVVVRASIIGSPGGRGKNMLFGNRATGIRFAGNLVIDAPQRNPEVSYDQTPPSRNDAGTTIDLRHNVFWRWGRGRGPRIEEGSTANVIANYFGGPPGTDLDDALIVCTGPATASDCSRDPSNVARAYVRGNVLHGSTIDLDARGTERVPFPAPAADVAQNACEAAARVLRDAGAQPRDAIDRAFVASVVPCGDAE